MVSQLTREPTDEGEHHAIADCYPRTKKIRTVAIFPLNPFENDPRGISSISGTGKRVLAVWTMFRALDRSAPMASYLGFHLFSGIAELARVCVRPVTFPLVPRAIEGCQLYFIGLTSRYIRCFAHPVICQFLRKIWSCLPH